MHYLWEEFWNIVWDLLVLAVAFKWTAILENLPRFLAWWDELWRLIEVRWLALWNGITMLSDYVSEQFNYLYRLIMGQVADVVVPVFQEVADLWAQLQDLIANLGDYVLAVLQDFLGEVSEFIQTIVDAVMPYVTPLIDAVQVWVQDTFGWLAGLELIISQWLPSVIGVIDWLKDVAWPALVAFLSDPLGYVLGALFAPISNVLNWWSVWGQSLDYFINEQLPGLSRLLGAGLPLLQEFVGDPVGTVLLLLEDVFLGWLERLIADNW